MLKRIVRVVGMALLAVVVLLSPAVFAAQEVGTSPYVGGRLQDTVEPIDETEEMPTPSYPRLVIEALADYFGVSAEEVQQLYDSGVGLGLIVHLYALRDVLGKTPQEMLAEKEASGLGWGQFIGLGQMDDKEVGKEARQDITLGSIMSGFCCQATDLGTATEPDQIRQRDRDQEQLRLRDRDQSSENNPKQEQTQQQTQAQTQEQTREQWNSSGTGQAGNDGGNGNSGGGGSNSGGGNSSDGGRGKNK